MPTEASVEQKLTEENLVTHNEQLGDFTSASTLLDGDNWSTAATHGSPSAAEETDNSDSRNVQHIGGHGLVNSRNEEQNGASV